MTDQTTKIVQFNFENNHSILLIQKYQKYSLKTKVSFNAFKNKNHDLREMR